MFAQEQRYYPRHSNNCHVFTSYMVNIPYKRFIASIFEVSPYNETPMQKGNIFVIYNVMKRQFKPLHSGVCIDDCGTVISKYGECDVREEPIQDTLEFYTKMVKLSQVQANVVVTYFRPTEL